MGKKIRVGILGLGRAGRNMHAPEIAQFPDFYEIAAGCDHAADRRENLPEQFKNARIYADYSEMLADPSLDMITVAPSCSTILISSSFTLFLARGSSPSKASSRSRYFGLMARARHI